jgi:RNA recognition motif-containing protein
MGINIYVGNLSFNSDENDLRGLFENYGTVDSAKIISDQFTGRSRGFGFVEMPNREEGLRAIEELDSKEFNGRSLKVNEARPRNRAGGDSRRDRGDRGDRGGRSRW